MTRDLVLGIDVGTQGARVVVSDAQGKVIAQASQTFSELTISGLPPGHLEQNPEEWWSAAVACLRDIVAQLKSQGRGPDDIVAGAVDSTSGTIALLNADNRPLRPALMYNDRRAGAEADKLNLFAADLCDKVGYRFNSSFALPKLFWLAHHETELWRQAKHIVHAADYIVGRLTGIYNVSDQSNALKTGFDLIEFQWPDFIGIDSEILPRVVRSGEAIDAISPGCARETGLSTNTIIAAGMTDGSADQVGSGAHRPGDWNTVLGTTIILKGLTRELLKDPLGRVYCHRHPLGYWMPGGASNVGARALDEKFPNVDKKEFDRAALALSPTKLAVYPLMQQGERFPFNLPTAIGFIEGEPANEQELYAAYLEGVAYTEKLAYDVVQELGAEVGGRIYTTGGGARSEPWLQLRADILSRELARAANASAAMGSAIIAASHTLYNDLAEATAGMVQIDKVVSPRTQYLERYDEGYGNFIDALKRREYL